MNVNCKDNCSLLPFLMEKNVHYPFALGHKEPTNKELTICRLSLCPIFNSKCTMSLHITLIKAMFPLEWVNQGWIQGDIGCDRTPIIFF